MKTTLTSHTHFCAISKRIELVLNCRNFKVGSGQNKAKSHVFDIVFVSIAKTRYSGESDLAKNDENLSELYSERNSSS